MLIRSTQANTVKLGLVSLFRPKESATDFLVPQAILQLRMAVVPLPDLKNKNKKPLQVRRLVFPSVTAAIPTCRILGVHVPSWGPYRGASKLQAGLELVISLRPSSVTAQGSPARGGHQTRWRSLPRGQELQGRWRLQHRNAGKPRS